MTKESKILLLGAGLLALFYVPTIDALTKLKVSFIGARLVSLKNETLTIMLYMQCDNNSGVSLTFQTGKIDMYFNRYYFGTSEMGLFKHLPAHDSGILSITVDVPFTAALKAAWGSLLDGTLVSGETLTLKGHVRVNNKTLPVPAITFNAEEIENAIS